MSIVSALRSRRFISSSGGGSDAFAVEGFNPDLVASFITQSDNSTEGEYFRSAGSDTTFGSLFTFARTGSAWYFNSSGLLTEATSGNARRDAYYYNSGVLTKGGLQLESAAATNSFTYSNDFSNSDWIKGRSAISSDAKTGLDGTTGNYLWTCNTTAGGASLRQTLSSSAGRQDVLWGVFESGSWNLVLVNYFNSTNGHQSAWFDLDAGSLLSSSGSVLDDAGIESLGSGRYLCWISFTPTVTGSIDYRFFIPDADGSISCDDGDSIYCYHAQAELGASVPSSPIITTGSTVTRAAETLSIAGGDWPNPSTNNTLSIAMSGLATYADGANTIEVSFMGVRNGANDRFFLNLDTGGAATGRVEINGSLGGTSLAAQAGEYTPGVNVPFSVAARMTTTETQVAKDGTAGSADTDTFTFANYSSDTLYIGNYQSSVGSINGFISLIRMWDEDITDTGLETATA